MRKIITTLTAAFIFGLLGGTAYAALTAVDKNSCGRGEIHSTPNNVIPQGATAVWTLAVKKNTNQVGQCPTHWLETGGFRIDVVERGMPPAIWEAVKHHFNVLLPNEPEHGIWAVVLTTDDVGEEGRQVILAAINNPRPEGEKFQGVILVFPR